MATAPESIDWNFRSYIGPYSLPSALLSSLLPLFVFSLYLLSLLTSWLLIFLSWYSILLQESVVTIAKLLLPQTFEEMAMQELRTLIAERSTMKIFISGEIIEIHQHVIGFILEGFVRTQGSQEVLITSPAALVPSHEDLGIQNSVTSGNQNFLHVMHSNCSVYFELIFLLFSFLFLCYFR